MRDRCQAEHLPERIQALATLRAQLSIKDHARLLNMLRYRWTSEYDTRRKTISTDQDKFWNNMAQGIQVRARTRQLGICAEWQGAEGRRALSQWLRDRWQAQAGLCGISHTPMALTLNTDNKCSPDRKSSNGAYTPENLWLVAQWVNEMKMDTSLIQFWQRISVLEQARLNR
jgi:hypothetical protein